MLDLGWSEMAVIAVVALLVLGPKELPNAVRTVALWVRKARRLAREFQSGVDELVREAELEDAKKTIQSVSRVNIDREMEKTIDPTGEVSRSIKADLEDGRRPGAETGPNDRSKSVADAPAGIPDTAVPPAEPVPAHSAPQPTREPTESPSPKGA